MGQEEAGQHLAGLYSLVATCESHGVDSIAYLSDVLLRIDEHPATQLDQLLPHNWTPQAAAPRAAA